VLRWLISALIGAVALPVAAQSVVTSAAPDKVAVSIYRDPQRERGAMQLSNLGGFALISETRTVDLPQGEADIRFEGVADGIIAVSAIVTGLPGGTVQKNRDAALLSPASLVDGTLGNQVMLRRTDRATGAVREETATVRSSAAGAVVVETAAGFETLRCTGLAETLVYNGVPAGLSARPTLSVRTRSPAAGRVAVTLTYLATGFDWAANYVAEVRGDGDSVDLLAWMTIANNNGVSFADASLNALAGSVNVDSDYSALGTPPAAPALRLSCFPIGSGRDGQPISPAFAPPPPPPPPAPMMAAESIVVTAMKRSENFTDAVAAVAEMEALGDLKLYRVPMATTVAARGQKQVALLVKPAVPVRRLYQVTTVPGAEGEIGAAHVLRIDNRIGKGLAEPLPSGQVAVFEEAAGERRYAGSTELRDHAVGETVNLLIGQSAQVRLAQQLVAGDRTARNWEAVLTNANPFAVEVEVRFDLGNMDARANTLGRLPRKDGFAMWVVSVPANATRKLGYRASK
jgi:hypothetical protein